MVPVFLLQVIALDGHRHQVPFRESVLGVKTAGTERVVAGSAYVVLWAKWDHKPV